MYTQVFQVPTFVLIYFAPTLYVAFWTTFFRGLYILCLHWKRTAEPLIKTTYSFSRWCFCCWWLLFCLGYRRLFFNGWVVFVELFLSVPRAKNHTLDPNWAFWLVRARGTFQFLVSIRQDPRGLSQAATVPSRCWYPQEHPCEYRKGERCSHFLCVFSQPVYLDSAVEIMDCLNPRVTYIAQEGVDIIIIEGVASTVVSSYVFRRIFKNFK